MMPCFVIIGTYMYNMEMLYRPPSLMQPGVLQVCGQKGHKAGFVGAVYHDCPNKPCYLCKQPGHTTATCPHRAMTGSNNNNNGSSGSRSCAADGPTMQLLLQREQVSCHSSYAGSTFAGSTCL
jgi:hypothetical protein